MARKDDKATEIGLLILRVGLGAILIYYGSQKVFGAFGGRGIDATLATWNEVRGIPMWLGMLAITSEFAGSIALILGLLTRVAAFGIACTMATAASFHLRAPGAMDAFATGQGKVVQDYGYPLALMIMAITLLLTGAGKFSLDRKLFRKGRG